MKNVDEMIVQHLVTGRGGTSNARNTTEIHRGMCLPLTLKQLRGTISGPTMKR
jgi:hypothetical protein